MTHRTLSRSPHVAEPLTLSCKMKKARLSSEDYNKVCDVQSKMALGEQCARVFGDIMRDQGLASGLQPTTQPVETSLLT